MRQSSYEQFSHLWWTFTGAGSDRVLKLTLLTRVPKKLSEVVLYHVKAS